VTDGINMLSGCRITSGSVKVTLEELDNPQDFQAEIDGKPVTDLDIFCADPLPPRYEINFRIPAGLSPGSRRLTMRLGRRLLPAMDLELAE